jgi:TM2 domain-containing membrane protein YozV
VKCSKCSSESALESRFCPNCGAAVVLTGTLSESRSVSSLEIPTVSASGIIAQRPESSPAPIGIGLPAHTEPSQAGPTNVGNTGTPHITIINQQGGGSGGVNPRLLGLSDRSPGLALALSFFICGVGQMYNGQVLKGLIMLISCVVLWFLLLGWIMNIWSMIDAYATAKRLRYQWYVALASAGSQGGGQVARMG